MNWHLEHKSDKSGNGSKNDNKKNKKISHPDFIFYDSDREDLWLAYKNHFREKKGRIVSKIATFLKKSVVNSSKLNHKFKRKIFANTNLKIVGIYDPEYYIVSLLSIREKLPIKEEVNLIYYTNKRNKNFGDELSVFITKSLINKNKYDLVFNKKDIKNNLVCIGSYIQCAVENSFIYGSGIRTDPPIEGKNFHNYNNLQVKAVRGPKSKQFLEQKGIEVPEVFGDPALLLPYFYDPVEIKSLKEKYLLIPHYSNYKKYVKKELPPNFVLVSPTEKWENIINKIYSCKGVVSSSLHGLICSDAFSVPNLWLDEYSLQEGHFKFEDYFASQGRSSFQIKNLSEFNKNFFYEDGNKIHLTKLIEVFPFK